MRRFNIAPRQACAHCQQWHWPPWGKVCMCVWGLAGWASGSRQERIFPTAVAIYLRLGPPGRSDTNGITLTVGRRVRRGVCGEKKRGGEGEGSMGRESLSGRNQSSRRERKGRTKELRNENRYKRRGCDSRSEWWREWEKREKEAADSGGGGGCGWSAVINKCFPWLLLRGEVTARVQEGLCSRSRPAELLWW